MKSLQCFENLIENAKEYYFLAQGAQSINDKVYMSILANFIPT
jgi:hypothetical protein